MNGDEETSALRGKRKHPQRRTVTGASCDLYMQRNLPPRGHLLDQLRYQEPGFPAAFLVPLGTGALGWSVTTAGTCPCRNRWQRSPLSG